MIVNDPEILKKALAKFNVRPINTFEDYYNQGYEYNLRPFAPHFKAESLYDIAAGQEGLDARAGLAKVIGNLEHMKQFEMEIKTGLPITYRHIWPYNITPKNTGVKTDPNAIDIKSFVDIAKKNDEDYLNRAKQLIMGAGITNLLPELATLEQNLTATPPDGLGQYNLAHPEFNFNEDPYQSAIKDTIGSSISNQQLAKQMGATELLPGLQGASDQAVQKILEQRGQNLGQMQLQYLQSTLQNENTEAGINERIGEVNMAQRANWDKDRNTNIKEQMSNIAATTTGVGESALNIFNLKNQNASLYALLQSYAKAGQWDKVQDLIASTKGLTYIEKSGSLANEQVTPKKV